MERMIVERKGSKDSDGTEKNHRNKTGLSYRRNIQMNLDIEKCDKSLDGTNVSEVKQSSTSTCSILLFHYKVTFGPIAIKTKTHFTFSQNNFPSSFLQCQNVTKMFKL